MPKHLQSYCGTLLVKDDEFDLVAERFIPREDGVSFRFSGFDNLGGFYVEGFARKAGEFYVAGQVQLNYHHYKGDNRATIDVTSVRESRDQTECHVLGVWLQNGVTWSFKGTLKPFGKRRGSTFECRATPPHVASPTELEAIKRKLDKVAREENAKAKSERKLQEYAERSSKKTRKSTSKAKRRDVFSKRRRIRGSAYSRRG